MKKLLFVFNPHSGTGKINKSMTDILTVFANNGYETTAYPTRFYSDGKEKIMLDGGRFDRVVVSGGDGMLHQLANAAAVLPEGFPTGYIPAGTVNDFARTHQIPTDMVKAAEIAVSDNIKALDLGKFGGEFFAYVAAFGFASNASYSTDQKAKNSFGKLAYAAEIIKNMDLWHFDAACKKMTITAGNATLSGEFVFGAVSNSTFIGGMNNLVTDDVKLDDGIFDGLFIRKPNNIVELQQLKKGLVERNFNAACLYSLRAERFEFNSEATPWTLDGENGGEHEKLEISVINKAFNIALP